MFASIWRGFTEIQPSSESSRTTGQLRYTTTGKIRYGGCNDALHSTTKYLSHALSKATRTPTKRVAPTLARRPLSAPPKYGQNAEVSSTNGSHLRTYGSQNAACSSARPFAPIGLPWNSHGKCQGLAPETGPTPGETAGKPPRGSGGQVKERTCSADVDVNGGCCCATWPRRARLQSWIGCTRLGGVRGCRRGGHSE